MFSTVDRKIARRGAGWSGLAMLASLAAVALLAAPGVLRAGEDTGAGDKTVRIGVVRLQEIVERYNRYTYVTARFTEDYKEKAGVDADKLEAAEKESQKYSAGTGDDMLKMLLSKDDYQKFEDQGKTVMAKQIEALLTFRDTGQLKGDLNTVMALATMEDIAEAVKVVAAGQHFDYVTDYFPSDTVQQRMAAGHGSLLDQSSGLLLENLQNRAPTLYADPSLDITEAVVKYLNDNYTLKYGAAEHPDPLLVKPLGELAAGLKDRLAAFQAAQNNRKILPLAPPVGAGYAAGVVNLQTIITNIMRSRKYDLQFEDMEKRLEDLNAEFQAKAITYQDHERALKQALQASLAVPPEKTAALTEENQVVMRLQRDMMSLKVTTQALNFTMSNKLFDEIVSEVRRQAQANGVRLVVATFSDEKSTRAENVERAMYNQNMVVWYRKQSPIDLTQSVLKTLNDQYLRDMADMTKSGQKPQPLGLKDPPNVVLENFVALYNAEKKRQENVDTRRFDQWHTFQKEVLHIEPKKPVDRNADKAKPGTSEEGAGADARPKVTVPTSPTP